MSLGDEYNHEYSLDGADQAEVDEQSGVTNQVNDGGGGLDCDEDHQELEGDQRTADQGLQVR